MPDIKTEDYLQATALRKENPKWMKTLCRQERNREDDNSWQNSTKESR